MKKAIKEHPKMKHAGPIPEKERDDPSLYIARNLISLHISKFKVYPREIFSKQAPANKERK